MSKIDQLNKIKENKAIITPQNFIEPENQSSQEPENLRESESSTVPENLSSQEPNSKIRKKYKTSSDSIIDKFNKDAKDEEYTKKSYNITVSQYKMIVKISSLYTIKQGKKIDVSEIVRNALDNYLESTYRKMLSSSEDELI